MFMTNRCFYFFSASVFETKITPATGVFVSVFAGLTITQSPFVKSAMEDFGGGSSLEEGFSPSFGAFLSP